MAKSKLSNAGAAKVLGCHDDEVRAVDEADEGTVATTFDGQRYLLPGDGTFVWLRAGQAAPSILGGE
jgi:hypothetical protein